jgi:hypothetical protein
MKYMILKSFKPFLLAKTKEQSSLGTKAGDENGKYTIQRYNDRKKVHLGQKAGK